MEKHPLHLKNPELQTSPEVERAVERHENRTGEKVHNDPTERIEAYVDRLENIFLNPDEDVRKRNIEIYRDKIYAALVIKRENFPESYFELQKRIARERGQAAEEISPDVREQMIDTAIEDQKSSLDAWIDYLTSSDAVYPAWFKYFVWKNVIRLSQFDKERGEFKKRTNTTVAPYPDIYREPLAQIADIYEKVKEDNKNLKEPEIREAFSKKFPALYAELIQKSLAAQIENKEMVVGQWVKYSQRQEGDAAKLFQSLEGKGTGWCTAGRSTAEMQINSGDFYVYYTNDVSGSPTQPRLAIRMKGHTEIGEVRGVLPHQGVEPILQEVLDEKLQEFGKEAKVYVKKSNDMRTLTTLEKKRGNGEPFTKDELNFLYEINSPIESFGYQRDPRIAEILMERNSDEDMLVVFDARRDQIAHAPDEINENTRAYVGELEAGIFQKLPEHLEHIYTSFPNGKIYRENLQIGGVSAESLLSQSIGRSIVIDEPAKHIIQSDEFITTEYPETVTLVRIGIGKLGLMRDVTIRDIYRRAFMLGLEQCPADTALHYVLEKPLARGARITYGMKPILINNNPLILKTEKIGDTVLIDSTLVNEFNRLPPASDIDFIFRLRKEQKKRKGAAAGGRARTGGRSVA